MFNIRKNKKGEILLDISFNPFRFLYNLLTKLDYLFSSKVFYTIPMGLGLGFGFAIIVFSQPTTTQADNSLVDTSYQLSAHEISIDKQNFSATLKTQTNYTLLPIKWQANNINFISFPNQENKVIIGSKDIDLEKITLGEKITILGDNNGIYTFSVFEIKQLNNDEINYLTTSDKARLVILSPNNQLGTTYLAALAK